jgi:hypothetical protein
MEFELKGALKKYGRMRAGRHTAMLLMAAAAFSIPWLLNLSRTDTLVCLLGAVVFVMTGQIEMRLKTIQIRLAGMDDRLDALSGRESEGNLIAELNDW